LVSSGKISFVKLVGGEAALATGMPQIKSAAT
jgi:hypothetical protein